MKKTKRYERLEKLAQARITVPKSEIDEREAEYEKKETESHVIIEPKYFRVIFTVALLALVLCQREWEFF